MQQRLIPIFHLLLSVYKDSYLDESENAEKIARTLKINNYKKIVSQKDLLEVIDDMSSIYTEPFADSSQIPTYLLSKFSKNYIKVTLTGDGGDEIFGGYNRYIYFNRYKKIIFLPNYLKFLLKHLLKFIPLDEIKKNKIQKNILNINNLKTYYLSMIDQVGINKKITNLDYNPLFDFLDFTEFEKIDEFLSIQIYDLIYYLPNDILVKTDRASMFNGIETRAPFLNKDIFETSLFLKKSNKISAIKGGKLFLKKF